MKTVILSSMGSGGSFWELVLPVWIIVSIAYIIDFTVRFIKRKRIEHREKLIHDLTAHMDDNEQTLI